VNLLGAFALAVTDRTSAIVESTAGMSPSAVSALSALRHFLDRPSLDVLRRVLGLTPSGAVRLVDRLAEAGLVTRGSGGDGRTRSVTLTAKGRRVADQISQVRAEALEAALDGLSPTERETLHELMGRVMDTIVRDKLGGAWICRQCDIAACGRADGYCPVANSAMKYASGRRPAAADA
jgi:DNA-binding MarR family transcriptional regulator